MNVQYVVKSFIELKILNLTRSRTMVDRMLIEMLDELSQEDFIETVRRGLIMQCMPKKDHIDEKKLFKSYEELRKKI